MAVGGRSMAVGGGESVAVVAGGSVAVGAIARAAGLGVIVVLGLGGCAGPEEEPGRAGGAIIGGTATTGDPAVVLLVSYPSDLSTFDSCTASVIAEDVLLTAAHCLDPETHPGYSFGVFTGADASMFETAATLAPKLLPAKEVHVHPDYDPEPPFLADIGVVVMEEALSIPPLAIQREPIGEGEVGEVARIVGYGQIKYEEPNARRHEATTVIAGLGEADTVIVGDLEHRSCIGDSGGPALATFGGAERIVGVDSFTELSGCLEPAHYRRPDVYTGFLDVYAPPKGGSGGGGAGGAGDGGDGGGGDGGAASKEGGGCSVAGVGGGVGGAGSGSGLAFFGSAAAFVVGALRRRRRRA